jgi:hypothetical protein
MHPIGSIYIHILVLFSFVVFAPPEDFLVDDCGWYAILFCQVTFKSKNDRHGVVPLVTKVG